MKAVHVLCSEPQAVSVCYRLRCTHIICIREQDARHQALHCDDYKISNLAQLSLPFLRGRTTIVARSMFLSFC